MNCFLPNMYQKESCQPCLNENISKKIFVSNNFHMFSRGLELIWYTILKTYIFYRFFGHDVHLLNYLHAANVAITHRNDFKSVKYIGSAMIHRFRTVTYISIHPRGKLRLRMAYEIFFGIFGIFSLKVYGIFQSYLPLESTLISFSNLPTCGWMSMTPDE